MLEKVSADARGMNTLRIGQYARGRYSVCPGYRAAGSPQLAWLDRVRGAVLFWLDDFLGPWQ